MNWQATIHSEVNHDFVSNPYPALNETIQISVRVRHNDDVRKVALQTTQDGSNRLIVMQWTHAANGFDYFACTLKISQPRMHYRFAFITRSHVYYYTRHTVTRAVPPEDHDFVILANFANPDWVPRSVFYQIFPDRFYNGDASNDIPTDAYEFDGHSTVYLDWSETPLEYPEGGCLDFFNGDLEGIRQKIPYLQELGVNALYLNPIFEARTHHRYDCVDYFNVDPALGGNQALIDLVNDLHAANMRIILDVSINHTGSDHHWLHTALADPHSPEHGFYYFYEGGYYHAWHGVNTLPQLNYNSELLREIIYAGEDALIAHYLREPYHIDGWRFDVGNNTGRKGADQFTAEIFQGVRHRAKITAPDCYLMGEHWRDNRAYLLGDQWDGAMNYYASGRPLRMFAGEVDKFIAGAVDDPQAQRSATGTDVVAQITGHYDRLPNQIAFLQFNLIDSHDVRRFHNDSRLYNPALYRGMLIIGFLLPGTFSVFYGDEVGLSGHIYSTEGGRYAMEWDPTRQDHEMFAFYQRLIQYKRDEPALHTGSYKVLYADEQTVVYARFSLHKAVIGVMARNKVAKRVSIPVDVLAVQADASFTDIFSGETYPIQQQTLSLELQPYAGLLLEHDYGESP